MGETDVEEYLDEDVEEDGDDAELWRPCSDGMICGFGQPATKTVTFGVDSGATATVIKRDECEDYPLDRRNQKIFTAANKTELPT